MIEIRRRAEAVRCGRGGTSPPLMMGYTVHSDGMRVRRNDEIIESGDGFAGAVARMTTAMHSYDSSCYSDGSRIAIHNGDHNGSRRRPTHRSIFGADDGGGAFTGTL